MNDLNESANVNLAGMPSGEMAGSGSFSMEEADENAAISGIMPEPGSISSSMEMGIDLDDNSSGSFNEADEGNESDEMPLGEMEESDSDSVHDSLSSATNEMPIGEMEEESKSPNILGETESTASNVIKTEMKGTLHLTFVPAEK